ncbi:MAG: hypothetical protein AAB268_00060 [Elusimicrobiota bacterium]
MRKICFSFTVVMSLATAVRAGDSLTDAMDKASQFKIKKTLPALNTEAAREQAEIRYYVRALNDPRETVESKQRSIQALGKSLQSGGLSANQDLGEQGIDTLTALLEDGTADSLRVTALESLGQVVGGVRLTWYPEGGGQCLQGDPGKGIKVMEGYCKIVIRILHVVRRQQSEPPARLSSAVKIAWIPTAAALIVPDSDFARDFAEGISILGQDSDLAVKKSACSTIEKLAKDDPKNPGIQRCTK